MKNSTLIIFIATILTLMWSIFYFVSHPRYFKSALEINTFCIEDPIMGIAHNSEYCIGYEQGYRWAEDQVKMQEYIDEAMEEISFMTEEELKNN